MINLDTEDLTYREEYLLGRHEITYIIKSNGVYKIGKSQLVNLRNRMYSFNLHNPSYEIIRIYNSNI